MIARCEMALRLAAGSFTPFLLPFWSEEEKECLERWLRGDAFPGAVEEVVERIRVGLGADWTVVPTNLGRTAIQMALEAMRLPPGARVLLSTHSCTGVVMPIIQAGHVPLFVDVDEHFNLRFESVLEADSPDVKAVILGHLSGCWARDTVRILEWARQRGVWVIEDAAQAQGLAVGGRPAGTFGDVGVFSAHGGKAILSSGGGWLVTRHPDLRARLDGARPLPEERAVVRRRIEAFLGTSALAAGPAGRKVLADILRAKLRSGRKADDSGIAGHRFEAGGMSDVEAKLILLQEPKLATILAARRRNALRWESLLAAVGLGGAAFPPTRDNVFVKVLLAPAGDEGRIRGRALFRELLRAGVEPESTYIPLHMRAPFSAYPRTEMARAERQAPSAFAVPARPNLGPGDWSRIETAVVRTVRAAA